MTERAKVLIVDDDAANRVALQAALDPLRQSVFVADSSRQCLRYLLDHDFAAIILDIHMPGIDGYETAKLIRARDRSRTTPILFLTAYHKDDADVQRGYDLGAVDYLFQPFDPRIVRAKIKFFVEFSVKVRQVQNQAVRMFELEAIKCQYEILKSLQDQKEKFKSSERNPTETNKSTIELEHFVSALKHDVNEPLRAISGFAALLAERLKGDSDPEVAGWIDHIRKGSDRVRSLISSATEFSKARIGKQEAYLVDSAVSLNQVLSRFASTIDENQATIVKDRLPFVVADEDQLEEIFLHLIDNAIKFRRQEQPMVHISAQDDGKDCVFAVRDNGIGIDPEFGDQVFRVFKRLNSRQAYPGQGLGLATCERIVTGLGGRIWFQSEPGQGSTFYFSLPSALGATPGDQTQRLEQQEPLPV